MEKIINPENLHKFARVNSAIVKKPIKGVVVSFAGLNSVEMVWEEQDDAIHFGERGYLAIIPYNNPWAWMNPQAVKYTDEIVDLVLKMHNLPDDIPIIAIGCSMGGQSALVYSRYAKRTPVACVVNCPATDMLYHYTERVDTARTLYSAFFNEEGTMEEALKKASPQHLIGQLPKIKYHVFHCDGDPAVKIEAHSDKFVASMKEAGYDISYDRLNQERHCHLTDEQWFKFRQFGVDVVESL